jgi:predicted transcriptional regulator
MDFDSFLTSPRWEILVIIAEKPSSPVEIAEKLNTTVSYISQQLKLLDAAGIVKKERTGAVEKGKPRALFSISDEFAYLTLLSHGLANKKLVKIDSHHKDIMKIWMIEDSSLHASIERLYWKLYDSSDVKGFYIEIKEPKIIIVSESNKLKKDIESFVKKLDKKIDISFSSRGVKSEDVVSLDTNLNKLKGGKND